METLLDKALAIAKTQIGVREEPASSNSGPQVNRYLESVGLSPGKFWCMAFVYWCFRKAYAGQMSGCPVIQTGGVMDHWSRAKAAAKIRASEARANPALIKPGLIGILLLDKHTNAGHTFIVESYENGALTTIEGNTASMESANAGNRNGEGVFRLTKRRLTDKS